MNVAIIDFDGFFTGYINKEFVSLNNVSRIVEEPCPGDPFTVGLTRWKWTGTAWEEVTDYRRGTWYNPENTSERHEAASWDDAPPAGWVYWAPGEEIVVGASEALQAAKQIRWEKVKEERVRQFSLQASTSNGIKYRISKDENNLMKLQEIRRAGKVPSEFLSTWVDDENTKLSLDQPALDSFTIQMGLRGQAIYTHSWNLRDLIESSSSFEELDLIDIYTGWSS